MIDVKTEKLISLEEAAELLGVTLKTVYVWKNRTHRKLETARPCGCRKIITSVEAVQRFLVQSESPESATVLPTGLSRQAALQQLQVLESM